MSDKFHEECAVMGVYGHPEASNMVYLGLYALQHRGQESCGIVSSDGQGLISHRQMGLVADAFKEDVIKRLEGNSAIGHNRYSTTGQSHLKNAQPFVVEFRKDRSPSRTMAISSMARCCAKNWSAPARFFNRPPTPR